MDVFKTVGYGSRKGRWQKMRRLPDSVIIHSPCSGILETDFRAWPGALFCWLQSFLLAAIVLLNNCLFCGIFDLP